VRIAAWLVVVATALASAGPAAAAGRAAPLPPPDRDALARLFDRAVAPLGLHVSRGALEDPPTYRVNPHGRHLAIYLQPTGSYTTADYARNITRTAAVFLPVVFRRWKDLRSFDVCQEPPPSVTSDPTAPPVTQLLVSRAGAARIDWRHLSLTRLLRVGPTGRAKPRLAPSDFNLYVVPTVRSDPGYARAATAAGRR
jgi:hypothetical protein